MRRIGLAIVVALNLLAAPLITEAQQAGRVYRIGVLSAEVLPPRLLPGVSPDDPVGDGFQIIGDGKE